MPRTRPLPDRKSLGTAYNLRPDTKLVRAGALRVGDVIVESPDCPAVVVQLIRPYGRIRIHARYVWEPRSAPAWVLDEFDRDHTFHRAVPGEY